MTIVREIQSKSSQNFMDHIPKPPSVVSSFVFHELQYVWMNLRKLYIEWPIEIQGSHNQCRFNAKAITQ